MTRSRHRSSKAARRSGRPIFGIELQVVDVDGEPLPRMVKAGYLQVRGHWVVEQYYGQDASALTAAGWFDTGDIGTLDANGYLVISDRAKDIIKSGGEWISTVELENIAIAHPGCAARRLSPPAIRAGTSGRCCCASVRKGRSGGDRSAELV